jgi:hypothetical protein
MVSGYIVSEKRRDDIFGLGLSRNVSLPLISSWTSFVFVSVARCLKC